MLTLKISLLLFAGITNCVLALLVLARNPRRFNAGMFALLLFSVGGWAIGITGFLLAHDASLALTWAKIYYAFPLLISLAIVYFVFSFPSRTMRAVPLLWRLFALLGLAVNLIPLLGVGTYLTRALMYHPWGKQVVLGTPEYALYSVYLLVCFVGALYVAFRRIKSLQGVYAEQARLFFFGFSAAAAFGVVFNLILPGVGNYQLIWLGPLFTTILAVAMAVSIVEHKMFDVRLAVARSLAYLISLGLLVVIFSVVVFIVASFTFDLHFTRASQFIIAIATALVALSFSSVKAYFDKITTRLFYHDAYEPQDLFDNLNRTLVSSLDLAKLLNHIASLLATSLKAEFCLVGLKETPGHPLRIIGTQKRNIPLKDIMLTRKLTVRYRRSVIIADALESENHRELKHLMDRNDIAVLVRLAPHLTKAEEGLGYLVLGPKKSGNAYTAQDARVLDTIANELIIAVQNALHFEEIQRFNETLQEKIIEATKELRRTNEKLKALDETKNDFISMASHQLRTPLTSVKGYLSLVLEGDAGMLNPQQRKLLAQSFASSQRMVYLISDLLNVSRLRTGKFIIETSQVNLADLITDEIEQLQETAATRSLTLTYDKPVGFPLLMLDETKTRQVIMNFIDNAIYYTPTGGHIDVRLVNKPSTVELRVVDDGIGVPRAEQHHLFTKFYRARNARKARPDGTGLGLFMAKKVITAQGGTLIFESQEGRGSTFGFMLSKAKLAQPVEPEPAKHQATVA